jgi:uncharacterized protein (TIGR03083 family)
MDPRTSSVTEQYLAACARFTTAVHDAGDADRWDAPSPCDGWDAKAVVEHVIGFHKVLVLDPLEADVRRPRGDEVARWEVTAAALQGVIDRVEPGLTATLTTELLVHAWDLATAVGCDATVDTAACEAALARAPQRLPSDMFAAPVEVPSGTDPQARLLAHYGRRP